ncbi:MAG: hypothetical protein K0Q49_791 [Haloplasmataceae bacterium]|nr:hypothetical protein [Haloplasmataceae bacterium]
MAIIEFNVNIDPVNSYDLIKNNLNYTDLTNLVFEELKTTHNNGTFGVLIFEKTDGNKPSIAVLIDNLAGTTNIKVIGSGAGTGWLYRFDWCETNLANNIKEILNDYIIE